VEDSAYFWVGVLLINLFTGKAYELMIHVVNPSFFIGRVEYMLSAIIVRLDGKTLSFFI
jgi:hypothetical protein